MISCQFHFRTGYQIVNEVAMTSEGTGETTCSGSPGAAAARVHVLHEQPAHLLELGPERGPARRAAQVRVELADAAEGDGVAVVMIVHDPAAPIRQGAALDVVLVDLERQHTIHNGRVAFRPIESLQDSPQASHRCQSSRRAGARPTQLRLDSFPVQRLGLVELVLLLE